MRASWLLVLALALLAVPRVVLHDLRVVEPGGVPNALLATVPPLVWVVALVLRRTPRPILDGTRVGVVYAVLLAAVHQLLWTQAYEGSPPRLGDQLTDAPDLVHDLVTRGAAVASSLVTGTLVGLAAGGVAWLLLRWWGGTARERS